MQLCAAPWLPPAPLASASVPRSCGCVARGNGTPPRQHHGVMLQSCTDDRVVLLAARTAGTQWDGRADA